MPGSGIFPDAPLRGLYARHRVYQSVAGMESFEPWLERLEKRMTERCWGKRPGRFPRSGTPMTGRRSSD